MSMGPTEYEKGYMAGWESQNKPSARHAMEEWTMASVPTEITVKVKADLSALRHATVDEVAAVLATHVYGDDGPVAGGDGSMSVCIRAAADLCQRFQIIPA